MNPEDKAFYLVKQAILREALQRAAIGAARLRRLGQTADTVAQFINFNPQMTVTPHLVTPEQQAMQQRMQMSPGFFTPQGF